MSTQFLAPDLRDEDEEVERSSPPAPARRVRRAGASEGTARDRARRGEGRAARRSTTCSSSARPGSARRGLPTSFARSSASASAPSPAPRSSGRTSPRSSPRSRPRDVVFVDEIHRLSRAAEEILYPALEDFRLDIVMGQGPAARTLTLDLPPFTLVGATTRTGLLTSPLRDRFGMTFRLDYYEAGELAAIVRRSAGILGVAIDAEAADEIAGRARGTPRVANRILRRVRDVAEVRHEGAITMAIAREALELLEVDEAGLERLDRDLLRAIVEKYGGGPVGRQHARRFARRGAGHDRVRLRAVSPPARLHRSARRAGARSPPSAERTSGPRPSPKTRLF